MSANPTTLVLAAHPDDEVLGCGGTIARLAKQKSEVYIAILGEGVTSRSATREQADSLEVKKLHNASQQVADLLGATQLFMYSLPDNRFDTVPLLDVVKIIEDLIDQLHPSAIYTQHGGDLNVDHNVLYRATLTATRPIEGHPVKALYSYEVASSTEWAFHQFKPEFHPNTFVDISETLDLKIRAMESYEIEARAYPHPRSSKALKSIAQRWGSTVGLQAAEAFQLIRQIS